VTTTHKHKQTTSQTFQNQPRDGWPVTAKLSQYYANGYIYFNPCFAKNKMNNYHIFFIKNVCGPLLAPYRCELDANSDNICKF